MNKRGPQDCPCCGKELDFVDMFGRFVLDGEIYKCENGDIYRCNNPDCERYQEYFYTYAEQGELFEGYPC